LLAALSGLDSDRTRTVAHRARRVVSTSAGVIQDQEKIRRNGRALAAAAVLVILLIMGPLIWWVFTAFSSGERLFNLHGQLGLLIFFLGGAMLASLLLAGFFRKRP
jgi:hypothetical protein